MLFLIILNKRVIKNNLKIHRQQLKQQCARKEEMANRQKQHSLLLIRKRLCSYSVKEKDYGCIRFTL